MAVKAGHAIAFDTQCRLAGIPVPVPEYRFAPPRRWRFDYAWLTPQVALEVEGGAFTQGRHTRADGFIADMEKYNRAVLDGWRVFRVTPTQLRNGAALVLMQQVFSHEP